ncbi:MAG: VWA domain-containing protein [Anaerolineaceae bacterium]|nr:VWA domain-containing protein [Anaerolineaceae bacterium]
MQLKNAVEPFGEVNVYDQPDGSKRIVATILMETITEGTQTGLAIDGSGSMQKAFGFTGMVSSIFANTATNHVKAVAQQMCSYLANKIDADGGTTAIYWATGPGGAQIQEIGDLTGSQAETFDFKGPQNWGSGTQLLPAVKYFVERFADADWGMYVFITDGAIEDLEAVKDYTRQLATDIDVGRRFPVKLVLIGLGEDVDQSQMEELDDLETGTDVDIWDHKLAAEMRHLAEIFAEVVDKNARVADSGTIKDSDGNMIKNYSDVGLPAYLEFILPPGSTSFTLEVGGQTIRQPL